MKVLVEVKDSKADFFMELMENFSYVKAKQITPAKALLMEEIKEAVEYVNLIKQGKMKARPVKYLLDEV